MPVRPAVLIVYDSRADPASPALGLASRLWREGFDVHAVGIGSEPIDIEGWARSCIEGVKVVILVTSAAWLTECYPCALYRDQIVLAAMASENLVELDSVICVSPRPSHALVRPSLHYPREYVKLLDQLHSRVSVWPSPRLAEENTYTSLVPGWPISSTDERELSLEQFCTLRESQAISALELERFGVVLGKLGIGVLAKLFLFSALTRYGAGQIPDGCASAGERLGDLFLDRPAVAFEYYEASLAQVRALDGRPSSREFRLLSKQRHCLAHTWATDPSQFFAHCEREYELLRKHDLSAECVAVLLDWAHSLAEVGANNLARDKLRNAIQVAENAQDLVQQAEVWLLLARSFASSGNAEQGLHSALCSLEIDQRCNDLHRVSVSASLAGTLSSTLKKCTNAMRFHRIALRADQITGNFYGQMYECEKISLAYRKIGNHVKALQYSMRRLEIAESSGAGDDIFGAVRDTWLCANGARAEILSLSLYKRFKQMQDEGAVQAQLFDNSASPTSYDPRQAQIVGILSRRQRVTVNVALSDQTEVLFPFRRQAAGRESVAVQLSPSYPHRLRFCDRGLWATLTFGGLTCECFFSWRSLLSLETE